MLGKGLMYGGAAVGLLCLIAFISKSFSQHLILVGILVISAGAYFAGKYFIKAGK